MNDHTPTPWELRTLHSKRGIQPRHDDLRHFIHADETSETVAEVNQHCDTANAAFIVRACNAHDDLVEALRALVDDLHKPGQGGLERSIAAARSLLAKAKGE